MPKLLYLDSSALVKLVRHEPETQALLVALEQWPEQATSVVGDVEVRRVAWREGVIERVEAVLGELSLMKLDHPTRQLAGRVGSSSLRSLDAIHLASALSLGNDLGAFCCYDRRLAADAEAAGLTVLSPGLA